MIEMYEKELIVLQEKYKETVTLTNRDEEYESEFIHQIGFACQCPRCGKVHDVFFIATNENESRTPSQEITCEECEFKFTVKIKSGFIHSKPSLWHTSPVTVIIAYDWV